MMEKGATLDADVGGKMMDEEVAVGDADAHVKAKSKKKRRYWLCSRRFLRCNFYFELKLDLLFGK